MWKNESDALMAIFSKRSFVGIDIGSFALKAVQVEKSGNTWRVSKSVTAPTPSDSIRDGVVIEVEVVGAAIKSMLMSAGIWATNAHIATSGPSVFVRVVPFPKMTEAVLRKSIKYEAGRYVPGSIEDSYIEFEIIGPINDTQMSVLIVAAPREIVESRMRACEAAGLEVDSVDIDVFASYRSLLESTGDSTIPDTTVALVDVGSVSTSVSVVDRGVFSMYRSIPAGGQTLTDELKKKFSLSDEDAEAGKAQLDVKGILRDSSGEGSQPLKVIQPHLEDLVREIRRSTNFYQAQQQDGGEGRQVDRIILSGGGAKMNGLAEYLAERLSIPVTSPGVFGNPRILPPGPNFEPGHDLAVATGLALKSYGRVA
ncbi:pilus assembly protein PilM [soil metagenome]